MSDDTAKRRTTLTIVMPVYGNRDLVAVMVDSILHNDYADYTLLLVDDGSDAETLTLLRRYALDERVSLIRRQREPKGAPTCRNIGFDATESEYVMFLDSDDYVTPQCLRTRVEMLAARPDLDFMVFPSAVYDGTTMCAEPLYEHYGYPIYDDDIAAFARRLLPFVTWNNIYRAAALRRHGIRWDEALLSLQDADYNIATLLSGMRYAYADTAPCYGYRICTPSSVSRAIVTQRHFESHLHAVRKMYCAIRSKYGKRYDGDLLYGLLRLYNSIVTGAGADRRLTEILTDGIRDIAPWHARLLSTITSASALLEHIVGAKRARQLPMLPFLLLHCHRKKSKTRKIAAMQRP